MKTIQLPPETYRRLKVAAEQRGIRVVSLATVAIEAYLDRTARDRG